MDKYHEKELQKLEESSEADIYLDSRKYQIEKKKTGYDSIHGVWF